MEETIKNETKPEVKPEVNPPTGGGKKGGKGCLTVLLVVIIIVVLMIVGGVIWWKAAGKKMIEKGIEKIPGLLEQGTGTGTGTKEGEGTASKVNEGAGQTQNGTGGEETGGEETLKPTKKWPAELPSDLLKFEYGRLTDVSAMAIPGEFKTWNLEFEDVKTNATDDYVKDLKDKGWTITYTYSEGSSTMNQASKGKWEIQLGVDTERKTAGLTATFAEAE